MVSRDLLRLAVTTQPGPTYAFVGNLFQAFVMYARVGLRGSRRFGLVWFGSDRYLTKPGQKQIT